VDQVRVDPEQENSTLEDDEHKDFEVVGSSLEVPAPEGLASGELASGELASGEAAAEGLEWEEPVDEDSQQKRSLWDLHCGMTASQEERFQRVSVQIQETAWEIGLVRIHGGGCKAEVDVFLEEREDRCLDQCRIPN
jgi:hypothetical protein